MNKFFSSIAAFYSKLRKNKLACELIFWISSLIVIAFLIVTWVTSKKLFLIGSAVGFIGIIIYFLLNPEIFKESIKEVKSDKIKSEGLSVTLRIIIAVAIAIALLAILNGKLPKIDLTSSGIYTISKESKELVKTLDKEMQIIYFATTSKLDSKEGSIIQSILKQYEKFSKNIKLEIVDLNKRPDLAAKYGINEDGTVYLAYNERNKKLSSIDFWEMTQAPDETSQGKQLFIAEKLISSAIRYLLSAQGKKIYFVMGHGEKYTNDYQEAGYGNISEYLGKIDREVVNINLLEKGKIPEDASVLVIAAPKEDYSKEEIKIVEDYISKGGKFVLITDFDVNTNIVAILLKKYDVIQEKGVVADNTNYFYGLGSFYPISQLAYHKITEKVQEYNKPILVSTAAPLILNPNTPKSEDYIIISLGNTFETAYNDISKDYDFKSEPSFDKNTEKKGVKHIGFVIESLKEKNKKGENAPIGLIFSDSDMFTNKTLKLGNAIGNLLLFENSINFLVDDFALLNIPGKDLDTTKVTLSAKAQKLISLTSFVFLELLMLLIIFGIRFARNLKSKKEVK
ncbi:MAG: GldG family protein [Spirochaetales bacterium]|jgi:hypothetical protein|nr:GldG family protein [Exilispira sp.]NMC68051.1 GldG family protein [Spirochaetales bacterium]